MQFMLALACRKMDLTPAQAIAASTINAAAAALQRQEYHWINRTRQTSRPADSGR
jgi:hypothetical protein